MGLGTLFEAFRLVKETVDIIQTLKGSKAAQEHLDLLRAKLEFLGEEKAQTEEQARHMEKQIADLQQELQIHRQFRVWRGANWRLLPTGGFDLAVYCGACAMPAFRSSRTFTCSCGWHSLFPASEKALVKILTEVGEAFGEPVDQNLLAKRFDDVAEEPKAVRRVASRGAFGSGAF